MSGLAGVGISARVVHYVGMGLAALALLAVIVLAVVKCKQIDSASDNILINSGADHVEVQHQAAVINAIQAAEDATRNPTGNQLDRLCSKYDRNCPANGRP